MAKRRKEKDDEEEKPFKLPKFDEEKFLKRERRNIKTTFLSFIFGFIIAFITFGFYALLSESDLRWPLVLLFGVFTGSWLKYLYVRLNIDLTDFGRKNWFSSYMIYFFTWLIVLIILVNPPFYDDEVPRVEVSVLPGMQEPGGDILIAAKITDNVEVKKSDISLEITDPDGNKTTLIPDSFEFDDVIVTYYYENNDNLLGDFTYTLTVEDVNGKITKKTGSFTYDDDVIDITSSRFENLTHGDDITIEVDEEISKENFRVFYRLNDGEEINVNRKYTNIKREYETSPEYEGWDENSKYNMTVYVEVSHYFQNVIDSDNITKYKYSNIVKDTTNYSFSTDSDNDIGDETPPMPWDWDKKEKNQAPVLLNYDRPDKRNSPALPHPSVVQAPGFETIITLLALAGIALIFKYRKKNRSNHK